MPPQAYALVLLFAAISAVVGWLAVRLVVRAGGPAGTTAYLLPFGAAFGALYLAGHRLGIVLGPEVSLLGFDVALLGDTLIGFVAALVVALAQAAARRAIGRGAAGAG